MPLGSFSQRFKQDEQHNQCACCNLEANNEIQHWDNASAEQSARSSAPEHVGEECLTTNQASNADQYIGQCPNVFCYVKIFISQTAQKIVTKSEVKRHHCTD